MKNVVHVLPGCLDKYTNCLVYLKIEFIIHTLITIKMNDNELILRAVAFASEKHQNQRRKNQAKTPYINHPIAVANYIVSIGGVCDVSVLCAALLHDTIEDTQTSYDELKDVFGVKIANIVKEVTDDKSLSKVERKKLQIEHAAHASYEAKLVKLADKLHNLSDLLKETPNGWTPEIVTGYFVWSHHVVKGIRGTNADLENALDKVFAKVISDEVDLNAALHDYYERC